MTGTGNDFVLIDTIRHDLGPLRTAWPSVARRLCHRATGPGADGLLVLSRSATADVRMRIFNPDGSEPSMCGNGIRCLARYVIQGAGGRPTPAVVKGGPGGQAHPGGRERRAGGAGGGSVTIDTRDGIKRAVVQNAARVTIDMGIPRLIEHLDHLRVGPQRLAHLDLIDSGVPHLVCWVDDVARIDVEDLGRRLRRHPRFRPAGVNVDFIQLLDEQRASRSRTCSVTIRMRTYERGVEGETRACGTGAVAAATSVAHASIMGTAAHDARTLSYHVQVRVPGGLLRVRLDLLCGQDGRLTVRRALLEGEARELGRGTVRWNGKGVG
ncbi:MAG: hypothetical protein Q8R91_00735 [Candidatus Omnitrophota bacterium]|nr:hypothetical protein [Candidatus Omnitrophota bacterium]